MLAEIIRTGDSYCQPAVVEIGGRVAPLTGAVLRWLVTRPEASRRAEELWDYSSVSSGAGTETGIVVTDADAGRIELRRHYTLTTPAACGLLDRETDVGELLSTVDVLWPLSLSQAQVTAGIRAGTRTTVMTWTIQVVRGERDAI